MNSKQSKNQFISANQTKNLRSFLSRKLPKIPSKKLVSSLFVFWVLSLFIVFVLLSLRIFNFNYKAKRSIVTLSPTPASVKTDRNSKYWELKKKIGNEEVVVFNIKYAGKLDVFKWNEWLFWEENHEFVYAYNINTSERKIIFIFQLYKPTFYNIKYIQRLDIRVFFV